MKTKTNYVSKSIRLPLEQCKRLEEIAKDNNITLSAMIRRTLEGNVYGEVVLNKINELALECSKEEINVEYIKRSVSDLINAVVNMEGNSNGNDN